LTINHDCHISIGNFNEEEEENNQGKDIEDVELEDNEDEKKERFFSSLNGFNDSIIVENTSDLVFLVEGMSTYSLDIQLPPPEYLI